MVRQFQTRNFLLRLDQALQIRSSAEILPPSDMPKPCVRSCKAFGFEDLRLFAWRGETLWGSSCVRELTPEGWCSEQVLARIDQKQCRGQFDWLIGACSDPMGPNYTRRTGCRASKVEHAAVHLFLRPGSHRGLTKVIPSKESAAPAMPPISLEVARRRCLDDGWLALIHEARVKDGKRLYWHRFVWFDESNRLRGVSRQCFFNKKGIEFAAGLAWHPDGQRLLISYGVDDREAWIATVEAFKDHSKNSQEYREKLPSGAPGSINATSEPKLSLYSVEVRQTPVQKQFDKENIAYIVGFIGTWRETRSGSHVPDVQSSPRVNFSSISRPSCATVDSPAERRKQSRAFDARMEKVLAGATARSLPQVHSLLMKFLSETAQHHPTA